MARIRWKPPEPTPSPTAGAAGLTAPEGYAPAELPTDAPPGARQAWTSATGRLVITGDPDPEDEGHNCDFLGCGWDHVLELRDPQGAP